MAKKKQKYQVFSTWFERVDFGLGNRGFEKEE